MKRTNLLGTSGNVSQVIKSNKQLGDCLMGGSSKSVRHRRERDVAPIKLVEMAWFHPETRLRPTRVSFAIHHHCGSGDEEIQTNQCVHGGLTEVYIPL